MKHPGPRVFPNLVGCSVAVLLAMLPCVGRDDAPLMNINVRASVDDRWEGFKKKKLEKHGQVYAIIAVSETPSAKKLVRPVDQGELAGHLRRTLGKMGFREIQPGERGDIALTVLYGRGYLKNPHLTSGFLDEAGDIVPVLNIVTAKDAFKHREIGFEAKVQAAQLEKLFIAVTAYQFPTTEKEKPRKLWKTLVLVDDPDNRDLNKVIGAMLDAAAGHYDSETKDGEVTIRAPIPEGTVVIGPMEVLGTDVPRK